MKKILLSLVLLSFGLHAIPLHGQVLAGTREQVEVLSRLMPQSQAWRGMSVPRPEGYAGGPLIVLHTPKDPLTDAAARAFFAVDLASLDLRIAETPIVVLRNEAAGYLLIGARDLETLKKAPADKEAGQGLLWITSVSE